MPAPNPQLDNRVEELSFLIDSALRQRASLMTRVCGINARIKELGEELEEERAQTLLVGLRNFIKEADSE